MGGAIKKVWNTIKDPIGKAIGSDKPDKAQAVSAPEAPVPLAQAVQTEAPKSEDIVTDDARESAKRKVKATGKKGLSVKRSSGTGSNI